MKFLRKLLEDMIIEAARQEEEAREREELGVQDPEAAESDSGTDYDPGFSDGSSPEGRGGSSGGDDGQTTLGDFGIE